MGRDRELTVNLRFMEDVDRELSEAKLSLNARARIVAESYLSQVRPARPLGVPSALADPLAFLQFA